MAAESPLTIAIFADTNLSPNGVRTFCRTFREWAQRTDSVRVVEVMPGLSDGETVSRNTTVISIKPSARIPNPVYPEQLLGYYSRAKVTRIIEAIEGPKIVHIATPGMLSEVAAKVARSLDLPIVGCYHFDTRRQCVEPYLRVGGWISKTIARFLDRRAYGTCLAMCAPSKTAADAAKSFYDGRVQVIPNPMDLDRFRPAADREGAFRKRYASDGKVLAVVIGRIAREKNLDLFGEYLLADNRINTVFVGDGPYAGHLRRRWNATVTGFLRGDELTQAFQQADVFVQLSVAETFGLTLAEAMTSGLPAVVLRSGGFVDTIPPGNGVEIVDREDLDSLGDRCVALVGDEARHREASRRVRLFAGRLSADQVLPEFVDFHRAVLA
ncbi:MAG: glycosyltransferase [Planctomycetes bacterium]|nr:glycosyltransferase [Planctomycetota bacterium]